MKNITHSLSCVLLVMCGLSSLTSCKNHGDDPTPTPTPTTVVDSLRIGLIAYYPLNNSGADSSGKGNDVAYYSNMTPAANRFGKANSAFYFDGLSSYMAVNDNASLRLNNTDFTVSAWVKVDYNASGYNILSKHITGNDNGWTCGIGGTTGLVTFGPGSTSVMAVGGRTVVSNQWHMITSVFNNTNKQLTIYVDGVLDNVTSNFPSPNAAISASMYIGRDEISIPAGGHFFRGALDDVRIYNRILTAKEVQKLFAVAI
ncbi:concanavalin A-like lectin/glucanase superfamily protein [Mucilaginibacter gracilis]|uniref:Concanavalin A-like lectin/glucanase superfamily protein n=1 Tax=Mucilaginibacter gracilis TaxID=423350 RepID=A0A495IVR5_9SPHI|nr:LamG domain-containing protein [Mucilaginibacter gracilis]RKR80847.1 concanavalin A-like lectin/glucanase superfamily protein [Mucilaginibacter gracilis]